MKRSALIIITLSFVIHSFSVLAMRMTIKEDEPLDYHKILSSKRGMDVSIEDEAETNFGVLPDDMIFHEIFSRADAKTLGAIRLASRRYKEKVDAFCNQTVMIDFKKLESGWLKKLLCCSDFNYKKVKELLAFLQKKLSFRGQVKVSCTDGEHKAFETVTEENVRDAVFKMFKNYKPFVAKKIDFFCTLLLSLPIALVLRFVNVVAKNVGISFVFFPIVAEDINRSDLNILPAVTFLSIVEWVCTFSLFFGCQFFYNKYLTIREKIRRWRLKKNMYYGHALRVKKNK